MVKSQPRNALQQTYDSYGFANDAARGLRMHLEHLMKSAPGLTQRVGIISRDLIEIRRIEAKLSKIRDYMYDKQAVY